jgi:thiosulfate dehydrogenase [quinone] large subunit
MSWLRDCPIEQRRLAALLVRWFLGLMFFTTALAKLLGGYAQFVEQASSGYEQNWLPVGLATVFLWVLPWLELLVGALLLIGLFRIPTLVLTVVLTLLLTYGKFIVHQQPAVAQNTLFFIVAVVGLMLVDRPLLALDGVFGSGSSGRESPRK